MVKVSRWISALSHAGLSKTWHMEAHQWYVIRPSVLVHGSIQYSRVRRFRYRKKIISPALSIVRCTKSSKCDIPPMLHTNLQSAPAEHKQPLAYVHCVANML